MNLLYGGKYRNRFFEVTKLLDSTPDSAYITEVCFGDTYIAEFCKKNNHKWIGIDLNPIFVKEAKRKGYLAIEGNILEIDNLPESDYCIMMGSLYHFNTHLQEVISKMFNSSTTIIISEPIKNLSNVSGLIGYLAKRAANAGKGREKFRFTEDSLMDSLNSLSESLGFKIVYKKNIGKDIILKLVK